MTPAISQESIKQKQPTIGLIGVGKFGKNYLKILKELHEAHKIIFWGGAVASTKSLHILQERHPDIRFTQDYQEMLDEVDAVCIATPAKTHHDIAGKCLKKAHALVEKPVCTSSDDTSSLYRASGKKILMPGHIFRFHPVSEELQKLISQELPNTPQSITGSFINPIEERTEREPILEFIHWIDLIMHLFPLGEIMIDSIKAEKVQDVVHLNFTYQHTSGSKTECKLNLGWGHEKTRDYTLHYTDTEIQADYITEKIVISRPDEEQVLYPKKEDALTKEILFFIDLITGQQPPEADISSESVISTIVVAEKAKEQYEKQQ